MGVDLGGLFSDLVRLETELWDLVDSRLRDEHGLSLPLFEVMQVIGATPGCRVLDVTQARSITVGGASKVVDKAQMAGWCRRLPNPRDGRSSLIELTNAGGRIVQAATVSFHHALVLYVADAATAAELEQLSRTVRRLRRHLDTGDRVHAQARR